MQSFVWKPGISVSTASLGNSGVIDTLNPFDHLDATESGWEYQPYELAGSRKRPKRRRLVPKCTSCACSVCCALGICALVCPHGQAAEQEIKSGTPLRRTAAEHREHLTRQVEEDFIRHGFRGLACAPKCSSARLAVATASRVESDSAAKTALNVIAETKAFLDVNVVVECPNGEEVVTTARLDTAANTDVVAPKLANVLKLNKVQCQPRAAHSSRFAGRAQYSRPVSYRFRLLSARDN